MEIFDRLPQGIVSVLQTPFGMNGEVDKDGLARLVEHAAVSGASGVMAPVVASEVSYLSSSERTDVVCTIAEAAANKIPLIVGASSSSVSECRKFRHLAIQGKAMASLVAVPPALKDDEDGVLEFFTEVTAGSSLPLLIQDLDWNGSGLPVDIIIKLGQRLPVFAGLKIETVPAGPKYTVVKSELGEGFYVCGGWAVPQMIEALDRGVDAMVPESSMVRVYREIFDLHRSGERFQATQLFRRLLPVLSFANQELATSIAFFKRLLKRKGIFDSDAVRCSEFNWDRYNMRIADELIDHYLAVENSLPPLRSNQERLR
jgi:4-hydroxy-tetrahydrodipicolinate synthase